MDALITGMIRFFKFLLILPLCCIFINQPAHAEPDHSPIRFGITGIILQDQSKMLSAWSEYLSARLGRPVQFITRDRYSDTIDMVTRGDIDFAWVSDYPYILVRHYSILVVTPIYHGKPVYAAYLIVHHTDHSTTSIHDLKGKVFAYADPNSHTGYLVPRSELQKLHEDSMSFFRKKFFAWGHGNIVRAVAVGLADGGYVDGYIWDSMSKTEPEVTEHTRVVNHSIEYAFPPIVARASLAVKSRVLRASHLRPDEAILG